MENIVVSMIDVVKAAGAVLIPFTLWGVKLLVNGQKEIRKEINFMREELKEYVTEKQCEAHRSLLQMQIEDLKNKADRRCKNGARR